MTAVSGSVQDVFREAAVTAREYRHGSVRCPHVLLALLDAKGSEAELLTQTEHSPGALEQATRSHLARMPRQEAPGSSPLSGSVSAALYRATEVAKTRNLEEVDTRALLEAILHDEETLGILEDASVDPAAVRKGLRSGSTRAEQGGETGSVAADVAGDTIDVIGQPSSGVDLAEAVSGILDALASTVDW